MVGIIVALALSWLLLFLIEKKNILALGFTPVGKRLKQFSIGFTITAILCAIVQYSQSLMESATWVLNEKASGQMIVRSFWWDFKSVLTEELIYRGAILYILIQRIGTTKGILVSAIAFGIYHWFSFGVLGNIMAMVIVFIGTGLMGYAWAWAFSKTKSMMLPFGLHLGWNFVHNAVFSKGPLGELLLIKQGGVELSGWMSLSHFVLGLVVVPILLVLYVKYFVSEEGDNSVKA